MIPDVSNRVRGGPLWFGFINTSRFAANAAGPLIATAVIANASPFGLYLSLSAFTPLAPMLFPGTPSDFIAAIS